MYGTEIFEMKQINNLFSMNSDSNIKHLKIQSSVVLHIVALYNEITAAILR